MKHYWYLFWASAVLWGFLAGYMLLLILRQNRTERRLSSLEGGSRRTTADQESSAS